MKPIRQKRLEAARRVVVRAFGSSALLRPHDGLDDYLESLGIFVRPHYSDDWTPTPYEAMHVAVLLAGVTFTRVPPRWRKGL